jgi:hypothetical protein
MRFPWQLERMRLNGGLEQQEPPRGVVFGTLRWDGYEP